MLDTFCAIPSTHLVVCTRSPEKHKIYFCSNPNLVLIYITRKPSSSLSKLEGVGVFLLSNKYSPQETHVA